MHLQLPPFDHAKRVLCVSGSALDVIVDLRRGSPMFRKAESFQLNHSEPISVFIPPGVAHGFAALEDNTIMLYAVTSAHAPSFDTGVRWNSIDFSWPIKEAVVSKRDSELPNLLDFKSPFQLDE
jgi:dTDP-4-dehydrorhamnose 3,5-epimerase